MPDYFDLEVALRHIEPRIWRRFLIRKTATFLDLHEAIQDTGEWMNYHLFVFAGPRGKPIAGLPDEEDGDDYPDAEQVRLAEYFGPRKKTSCVYLYDFGDGWELDVVLCGIVRDEEAFWRRLLDGDRAFPKEDCGGVHRYLECVKVASGGPDPERLRGWLGGWEPERFDLVATRKEFDLARRQRRTQRFEL